MRYLKELLGAEAVRDVLEYFIDLHAFVKENFFGVEGLGLKKVAAALGFSWSSDDAGGLQSQTWLQVARDADESEHEVMRARMLEYNEDDVTATAVIRDRIASVTATLTDNHEIAKRQSP